MVMAKDYKELCVLAAEKIVEICAAAVQARGTCRVALAGGNTPQGVYALMAGKYREYFRWESIEFFLGDERFVPASSDRSNAKMIADSGLPLANFHPVDTDAPDAETAASLYEQEVVKEFALKAGERPRFDLVLLGLGEDGHTASLFPDNPVLQEKNRLIAPVEKGNRTEERITLTLPVINAARTVLFLVSGPSKAAVLKTILEKKGGRPYPAGQVNPSDGEVWWLTDQDSAALLA
jgi:6-phosphogluconolactonase